MSGIIQLLPANIANQIAAGEVVQRPASVVKELIENAIDAKATHIQLIVKDAGRTLIQVIDNGCGMTKDDALMCFEPHATSKIKSAQDLFNLTTMGFRGEALASIAAIAHVELKTKKEGEDIGTLVEIEGNNCKKNTPVACDKGSSIAVKNLFFNVPARRNFLKSDNVENNHISEEFIRTALVNNEIAFSYYNNGKLTYKLDKTNHKKRIIDLFGSNFAERLLPIEEEVNVVSISGYVTKVDYAKKTRSEQYFFVNNRFMKSPYLTNAVERAYQNLVPEKHYPSFFINLKVDPKNIDVNIHPTKTEVKFLDEKIIYAVLYACVKKSLGQFTLAPLLDFETDKSFDVSPLKRGENPIVPSVTFNTDYNPFENKSSSYEKPIITDREISNKLNWENFFDSKPIKDDSTQKIIEVIDKSTERGKIQIEHNDKSSEPLQIDNKYIVTKIKSALVVVNQERASQRILFDKFSKSNYDSINSQQLIFPYNHFFSPNQSSQLLELLPEIRKYGFMLEYQKDGSFNIVGVPNNLDSENAKLAIEDILNELNDDNFDTNTPKHLKIALSMAKKLSIKDGEKLSSEEINSIVGQLFACSSCEISPFGKKIIHKIQTTDLEKMFE